MIGRSIALAGGLCAFKIATGWHANSLGILASALDSGMDLAASALNLLSLRVARKPPDAEHPYGRGKIEALAGLVQSVLIAGSGAFLFVESVRRLARGARVEAGPLELGVMLLSAALSLWHSLSLRRVLSLAPTTVVRAEAAHFATDFLSNLSVAAALLAVRATGSVLWDLILCAAISLVIMRQAFGLLGASLAEILDRRPPRSMLRRLEAAILSHDPRIAGFHELRARRAGPRLFVDLHVEIRGVEKFREAHELTETLIDRLKKEVPQADFTVHYDPEGGR